MKKERKLLEGFITKDYELVVHLIFLRKPK